MAGIDGAPPQGPGDPGGEDDPYRDADLYDLEYVDHTEDVAYYQAMAWQAEGEVLELACGTGRLTLPMARAGARLTAVDLSEAMLAGLRRRLGAEPPEVRARVTARQGDFVTLDLGRRFPLVLWPFNALHHCRTDAQLHAALDRLDQHLAPGGQIGLDAYLPDLALYDRDPNERFEERYMIDPATQQGVTSWEQGWWDAARRTHHVVYHYQSKAGLRRAHLQFTMWELVELRAAFAAHGFEVVHEAEDFRSTPLAEGSLKYVAVLQRR